MKISRLITILLLSIALGACNQLTSENTVKPGVDTNDLAKANLNLGIEYMNRGNYEKSLEKLDKALAADPRYPPIYNALGLLHQRMGQFDKAEDNFLHALNLNPSDSPTLNNYGRFLCQFQRYDEAEEIFLKAANNPLYETPEIAIANAGTCALINNKREVAENYFRSALKRNPQLAPVLIQMAGLAYDQGNYLKARAYLQRFLAVAKHTPNSLWLGIRIEQELGDKDTLSSYALLLRHNFPDSEEASLLKESGTR